MKDKEKQIGKFKNANALINAYQNLEKEFTKRCQKIKELEGKLHKDSVVLSREEYNDLILAKKTFASDGEEVSSDTLLSTFKEIKEQASKETAEKFYKKVRKLLKKVDIIVDGDEGLVGYEESAVDKGLTELAKQFGVEIKE